MRVVGNLKSFKENSRSIVAFSLTPVTDFNEITYHITDIIESHLKISKVHFSGLSLTFLDRSTYH